jgi:hypothetical protein
MDRVPDFESVGCGFESRRGRFFMMSQESDQELLRILLSRLERISVDSYWAHRASGIRGSLVRTLEKLERNIAVSHSDLKPLLKQGFFVLEQAAKEKIRNEYN